MKPALLVVDVQNQFFQFSPETAASLNKAIYFINAAIDLFRQKQLPIVVIQDMNEAEGRVSGTDAFALPEVLKTLPSDLHVQKTYSNAFTKTPLEDLLRERDVDTVVITGFCAEYCVLSTFRGALDCDLTPVLLQNALASMKPANIPFVESTNDIVSLRFLTKVLA